MIDDVDKTLQELLQRDLPLELIAENSKTKVSISFAAPDGSFPPPAVTIPAIDLFLYDVRENRDLRSNELVVERNGVGTATKKPAPVRVDCSYLITAWSSNNSPAEEHRFLSEVMKVLLRYPTLPAELLQGSLKDQEPPLPATTLQQGRLQSLGEFWQAMGGKPKAAFHYTVTFSMPVFEAVTGPVMTTRYLTLGDKLVQIGGQVRTAAGEGVPNARVEILNLGLSTMTEYTEERKGLYSFLRVPEGTHDFRVVAPGFRLENPKITVPGKAKDYEIILTPL